MDAKVELLKMKPACAKPAIFHARNRNFPADSVRRCRHAVAMTTAGSLLVDPGNDGRRTPRIPCMDAKPCPTFDRHCLVRFSWSMRLSTAERLVRRGRGDSGLLESIRFHSPQVRQFGRRAPDPAINHCRRLMLAIFRMSRLSRLVRGNACSGRFGEGRCARSLVGSVRRRVRMDRCEKGRQCRPLPTLSHPSFPACGRSHGCVRAAG